MMNTPAGLYKHTWKQENDMEADPIQFVVYQSRESFLRFGVGCFTNCCSVKHGIEVSPLPQQTVATSN